VINHIPDNLRTTVGNIKTDGPGVYIGRPMPRMHLQGSVFANPFRIDDKTDRGSAVEKYREWIMNQPDLVLKAVQELMGKNLLCWCHPHECHGDVLAEICNRAAAGALNLRKPTRPDVDCRRLQSAKVESTPGVGRRSDFNPPEIYKAPVAPVTAPEFMGGKALRLPDVAEAVSKAVCVNSHLLTDKIKTDEAVALRDMFVYVCRKQTRYSLHDIARFMGKKHSSVATMNARAKKRVASGRGFSWLTDTSPHQVIEKAYEILGVEA
jgi:hypothetical protein